MKIELDYDWYNSSGVCLEGVPTTFEVSCEEIMGDDYTGLEYTTSLVSVELLGKYYSRVDFCSVVPEEYVEWAERYVSWEYKEGWGYDG